MTDNTNGNGEANTINPSGGTPSRVSGLKKMTDQPALGAFKSFKGLVYKYNTKDQVDMYNRTIYKTSDWLIMLQSNMGQQYEEYSEVPRREGVHRARASSPTETDKKKSEAAFVRYKEMVNHFMRDMREYEDQKAKVFGVILGQLVYPQCD
jgi:hypothetical protein